MSNIFETIFNAAETALTDVITGGEAIAPVASAIPGAGAVVSEVQTGASAVLAALNAGRAIVAAAAPEVSSMAALIESIFHVTPTPGGLVLTAKTSVATVSTTPAATVAATVAAKAAKAAKPNPD